MNYLYFENKSFEELCKDFITENNENNINLKIINTIIMMFKRKNTTLETFFNKLKPFFVNTDDLIRSRACLLFLKTFEKIFKSFKMNENEFLVLFEFFLNKNLDISTVGESIEITNILIRKYFIFFEDPKENIREKISSSYFQLIENYNFHPSSYGQKIRFNVYKIFLFLTSNYSKYFLSLKEKFIKQILDLVENEKDPRNLILSFQLIEFLLKNFDEEILYPFKEDLFDYLSAYYPITFNKPENDNYSIESSDLENLLNSCLKFPLIVKKSIEELIFDKISSNYVDHKISCMKTLIEIFRTTDYYFIEIFCEQIWKILKEMIFDNTEKEIENKLLETFKYFSIFLLGNEKNLLVKPGFFIIKLIINELLIKINEDCQSQNSNFCFKIFGEFIIQSDYCFNYIISNVINNYFLKKMSYTDSEQSLNILQHLFYIFQSREKFLLDYSKTNEFLFLGNENYNLKVINIRIKKYIIKNNLKQNSYF